MQSAHRCSQATTVDTAATRQRTPDRSWSPSAQGDGHSNKHRNANSLEIWEDARCQMRRIEEPA